MGAADHSGNSRVVVIGGGPAGLAAAEVLSASGLGVDIYDAMPSFGRKFLMAGRGGLNLTHSEPPEAFLDRYGPARRHLEADIRAFAPQDLRDWAQGLGIETFVGSSGRVFPRGLKASPLLRAWLARLASQGVRFFPRHRWLGLEDGAVLIRANAGEGGAGDGEVLRLQPAATILALGGASWPKLGSDGGWVPIFKALGVAFTPFEPANAGFHVAWSRHFTERFAGQPLKSIRFSHEGQGVAAEAMITASGIEGGAIYALGRGLRQAITRDGAATLLLDLKPDLSQAALAERLARPRKGASAGNFLRKAAGLSPVAVGLAQEYRVLDASDAAGLLKALPIQLVSVFGLERAISSAGGIAWEALDRGYMLKQVPGVFVCGEMLDWEAPTGGYLLQACFATGRAAGRGVAEWLGN
ncbi:MAG TPA: TIGR03862 family flavoprotein [Stellaceae bacterium]|jgi:uncharacterized flavoprotein (TIGR03862 family)|nr:TIGR03862 family flavoprotein [Stellaceae bacterium]